MLDVLGADRIAAIRAWYRLDEAFSAFNRHLRQRYGVTGIQLAMLRILAEQPRTIAELRARLAMHPATIGQLLDRLERAGLVTLGPDPADRRRRQVEVTADGQKLLSSAPLAGPVRLRSVPVEPARARRLTSAFDDAIDLFGLREYVAP